jgi:hypothetical protein
VWGTFDSPDRRYYLFPAVKSWISASVGWLGLLGRRRNQKYPATPWLVWPGAREAVSDFAKGAGLKQDHLMIQAVSIHRLVKTAQQLVSVACQEVDAGDLSLL